MSQKELLIKLETRKKPTLQNEQTMLSRSMIRFTESPTVPPRLDTLIETTRLAEQLHKKSVSAFYSVEKANLREVILVRILCESTRRLV